MKRHNAFDLARNVCDEMNGVLESAVGATGVETTIDVKNEAQMEAVKILLETAISVAEIGEYNSRQEQKKDMLEYSLDQDSIQWRAEFLGDGKAKFSLSMEDKPLTRENVEHLLRLSLEGKFQRIQQIIEDLFPYNAKTDVEENITAYVSQDRIEAEIGGKVLGGFINTLCESHDIDTTYIYKPNVYIFGDFDENFVAIKASEAFIRNFAKEVNLHVEARAKEQADLELVKSVMPGSVDAKEKDIQVKSESDHVTVTISRELLQQLKRLQALEEKQMSEVEERTTRIEDILQKGLKQKQSHASTVHSAEKVMGFGGF